MIYESDYIWKIGPASQDLIEVPRETLQKAALKFRDLTEEHFEQLNKILNIDLTLVSTEYMIGIRVE